MPEQQNPTFIKIDEDKFYLAITSNEQFEISNIQTEIANLQAKIDSLVANIQGAAAQGVGTAQPLLDAISAQPLSPMLAKTQPLPISQTAL